MSLGKCWKSSLYIRRCNEQKFGICWKSSSVRASQSCAPLRPIGLQLTPAAVPMRPIGLQHSPAAVQPDMDMMSDPMEAKPLPSHVPPAPPAEQGPASSLVPKPHCQGTSAISQLAVQIPLGQEWRDDSPDPHCDSELPDDWAAACEWQDDSPDNNEEHCQDDGAVMRGHRVSAFTTEYRTNWGKGQ